MSAVDLLSDYEPATEVPTILANCGQQRDALRPLRVRAVPRCFTIAPQYQGRLRVLAA